MGVSFLFFSGEAGSGGDNSSDGVNYVRNKTQTTFPLEKISNGVNKIIARVNDDVITLRDLQEFKRSSSIDKPANVIDKQALENLIEEKLITQLAKKEKFKVDNLWVDKKMKQLISAYGGYNKFEESLAKVGLSPAIIEKKIKDNFLVHQAVNKYVVSKIDVSPMEITEYYKEHIKEFSSPPKYICWVTKSGKRDFLEKLSKKIEKEGFDKILTEEKDIFFKIESDKEGLNDAIREVVESIKDGQWKIKEIGSAYYLVYLVKTVPAHAVFLNEVRDKIYSRIWKNKFSSKFEAWIKKLKEKSLVKIYSLE